MKPGSDKRPGATTAARELATILAALRFYQEQIERSDDWPAQSIATNEGEFDPLTPQEIDALCERLNCSPADARLCGGDPAPAEELAVELQDQGTDRDPRRSVRAKVVATPYSIDVGFEGYGGPEDAPNGWPVSCDLYEGRLQVVVWADIDSEDPTHTIDLARAAWPRSPKGKRP